MSYSDLKAFGKDLLALTLNGSPRWRVFVMIGLVILSGNALWGYTNYARASDLAASNSGLNDIKTQLLTQSILSAYKEKCEAEKSGRYSQYWQEQLAKLKNDYWKLTGQSFELPPTC